MVATAEASGQLRSTRRRLATELVRLRDQAGLSGRELARRIGISQSKVSRIEAGATMPSMPEVTAWAKAVGSDAATRSRLRSLTEAAFIEVHTWRSLLRDRAHLQDDIAGRERAAGLVRVFQPAVVPGLLQTPAYGARVFTLFQPHCSPDEVAAATAGRVQRQTALRGPGRFEFLINESALRWRPAPRRLLVDQLEYVLQMSRLPSVSIGVVPLDATATTAVPHGFVIYGEDDEAYVTIETIHADVELTDPADVALYRDRWIRLGRMAVFGTRAKRLIAAVITELSPGR